MDFATEPVPLEHLQFDFDQPPAVLDFLALAIDEIGGRCACYTRLRMSGRVIQ